MDLMPSPEQDEIAAAVAAFLTNELAPYPAFGPALPPVRVEHSTWSRIAELGWFGLGLAEEFGGVGYGLPEEVFMFRELGRVTAPGPFLATVLGARTAALAGHRSLAADILSGRTHVGWARTRDPHLDWSRRVTAPLTTFDAGESGVLFLVHDGGAALFDRSSALDPVSVPCIDHTVAMCHAEFRDATPVAYVPSGVESILSRSRVLAAALAVGMAEATRDLSAAYAIQREQFGRPIGVNQGVKHRCADMAVRAEAALSLVCYAALVIEERSTDANMQADAALAVALDATHRNAADTVQVHGGIGFTWDHPAHRYVERSHVLDEMVGGSRMVLASLIAGGGPDL